MRRSSVVASAVFAAVVLAGGLAAWARDPGRSVSFDRKIKEADVPPAALAALRKLAGDASITEYEEETENGHTYYEGSWTTGDGRDTEGVVTADGGVIEVEEEVGTDGVPAAVREAFAKLAGADAKGSFERTIVYYYEVEYRANGQSREVRFTADGRRAGEENDDDDDDEKDDD